MKSKQKYTLTPYDFILDNSDKRYILKIKDLAQEDKPREKLLEMGPSALSSSELLAIVLGVGTKKEDVLAMSSRLLKEYGEKSIISQTNPKVIEKELSIPLNKASQIVACFELGRRFFKKNNGRRAVIRTADEAFKYMKDMCDLPKEHFRGIYLNSRNMIIHDEVISIGSLTANIVHPREVFKPALEYSAVAIIVAHNHPSGDCTPSESDIEITKQLIDAGRILGVDFLDHLVITKNKFTTIKVN
ncbi:DNA repair protein RadC [Patescibacteria group bacterium]